MLHTLNISGGRRSGKSIAALAYAAAVSAHAPVLHVSATRDMADFWRRMGSTAVALDLSRVEFTYPAALLRMKAPRCAWGAMVVDPWTRLSISDRVHLTERAEQAAKDAGTWWMVRVIDGAEPALAPADPTPPTPPPPPFGSFLRGGETRGIRERATAPAMG